MPISSQVDNKKPLNHHRGDSGELDVFEAARYYNDNTTLNQKVIKEERQGYLRGGRVSMDMPTIIRSHQQHKLFLPQTNPQKQEKEVEQQKKHKQPSSPRGKLAHFLNSLFSQTSSKKKKSSSKTSSTQSMKDEDENPNGRRKRRSSMSHFRSTSSAIDTKSIYSSSSSGFRTPPPSNINSTPNNKCYKEALTTFSKPKTRSNKENYENGSNLDWFDEKFKLRNGLIEKPKEKKREIIKEEVDDGAESDSSSDLFELKIDYQFGFCSTGLPVYETTHMDTIKRSSTTPITNGPIKI